VAAIEAVRSLIVKHRGDPFSLGPYPEPDAGYHIQPEVGSRSRA
jgi:hypothetical protein